MLIILKLAILIFLAMELSNIVILYFKPNFKYGNSMNTFKQWYAAQTRESDRLFVQYLVNWVANCKLIFLALLAVVVLFGGELITICAVVAMILSIAIYFVTLHPILVKLDAMGEIQPKGYSKTLALTFGAFIVMFSGALVLYFVLSCSTSPQGSFYFHRPFLHFNLKGTYYVMKKLNLKQLLSVSLTLFAIFFGAGNMIFPPAMGQLAGTNFVAALAGFIVTDAGIAILGMIAVVLVGSSMSDLGSLVSKKFAVFLSVGIYLLIGPLFALPRTGSASFELALLPYIPQDYTWAFSLLFTGCFFALTYYLSSNPSRVVDVVGRYMTPILLISILVIFLGCLFTDPVQTDTIQYGTLGAPQQDYGSIPFFQGMMEGYLALDGPAGLAFAIIVINALKGYGVESKKSIVKYTVLCGMGAALFLSVVYFMLSYAGAITATSFSNGGALLHALTSSLFGPVGGLILGLAVLLACLTTSIGLTTSFSDYFTELFPSISYKKMAAAVCIFSFVVSNIGLSQLIRFSLPVLMMIYPVSVVLILLSFFKKYISHRRMVYVGGMVMAFLASLVHALDTAGISFVLTQWAKQYLPFYALGLGWLVPALVGVCIGLLPFWPMNRSQHGMPTL